MTTTQSFPLTPNQITTSRILLHLVSSLALLDDRTYLFGVVCLVFGGLSDRLDGYVARRYGLGTEFGKLYDQLADKIAMLFLLAALVYRQMLPLWVLVLVLFRDFLASGLRDYALIVRGRVLEANWYGKRKAEVHWIGLFFLIVCFHWAASALPVVRPVVIGAVLLASYVSLGSYVAALVGTRPNSRQAQA